METETWVAILLTAVICFIIQYYINANTKKQIKDRTNLSNSELQKAVNIINTERSTLKITLDLLRVKVLQQIVIDINEILAKTPKTGGNTLRLKITEMATNAEQEFLKVYNLEKLPE